MADDIPDTDEKEAELAGEGAQMHSSADLALAGGGEVGESALESDDEGPLPTQIGYRRYVYAAFFVFAIALAYLFSRMGLSAWYRLSQYTPKVGEAREDLVTPVAAVIAGVLVFLTYRREEVRVLADEVALELSKVEWPTKDMVRRSTAIVVGASLSASFIFWIYDIGTNKAVTFVTGSQHPMLYGLASGIIIFLIREIGIRLLVGRE
jgi:preprotein translocase SecE subunit